MKKTVLFILFFITLLNSNTSFSQIDVDLMDIKSKKTIPFYEIDDTYNLKKEVPTLVITWSGKWCGPCLKLIDRYNNCDLSLLNVITINIDEEKSIEEVLKEERHLKWNKTFNFLANLGKDKKGFDNIFNISSAPMLLYLDNGKLTDAAINYSFFPYKLIEAGLLTDVKFIWNSSEDLNSLAWSYYENQNDTAHLETAKKWIIRSIELDKNYHNTDTYAALLFKTGEYTKALKTAKEAIEIAKETSEDYNSTTNLINKIIEKL